MQTYLLGRTYRSCLSNSAQAALLMEENSYNVFHLLDYMPIYYIQITIKESPAMASCSVLLYRLYRNLDAESTI